MSIPLYVWGTGELSRSVLTLLASPPVAYIDNAPERAGTEFEGRPVLAPASLPVEPVHICIASMAYAAIAEQIRTVRGHQDEISIATPDRILDVEASQALLDQIVSTRTWIADMISGPLADVPAFASPRDQFAQALEHAPPEGFVLEFGVFKGASIRILAELTAEPVYGFDSFEGLPEDWTLFHKKSFFDVQAALPDAPDHVTFIKGFFDQTLDTWLEAHPGLVRFAHLDADLFSSTHFVLNRLKPRLTNGTVLIFDDYLYAQDHDRHDYRAHMALAEEFGVHTRYIGRHGGSVSVQVTGIDGP